MQSKIEWTLKSRENWFLEIRLKKGGNEYNRISERWNIRFLCRLLKDCINTKFELISQQIFLIHEIKFLIIK